MKRILIIVALGLVSMMSMASNDRSRKDAKETRPNSIEMLGGGTFCLFKANGEVKKAYGLSDGGNFFYRYDRHFRNGFGAFVQIGSQNYCADEQKYFGAMNKADGEKYLYRFDYSDYNMNYYSALTVGGLYSFDFNRFTLRPRAGIGFADRDPLFMSYQRLSRDGSCGPQYFTYETVSKKAPEVDYLMDNHSMYLSSTTAVLDLSVQIVLAPASRVSLFVEAGMMADLSRMQVEKTVTGSARSYTPSTWAEAVTGYDLKESWVRDPSSSKMTYEPFVPAPMMRLSFGLSFNFGKFNR